MKKTARAFANIALVKYWGKRDEDLILPQNSSLSVTLSNFHATTTVDFLKSLKKDVFLLNGREYKEGDPEFMKIFRVLEIVRKKAKIKLKAKVVSKNNFQTAAGFASSAAGLAALSFAAARSAGLRISKKELSMIARQGSGSAARSVFGGFVVWKRGLKDSGSDSFAFQFKAEDFWPDFRIIAVPTTNEEKEISSSKAMKRTVKTSPFYQSFINQSEKDLRIIKKAIMERNFKKTGEIAEKNAFSMHATMLTSWSPIIYFHPRTIKLIKMVHKLRERNKVAIYVTMDAGPQVKIICQKKDVRKIQASLGKSFQTHVCRVGTGPREIKNHLF